MNSLALLVIMIVVVALALGFASEWESSIGYDERAGLEEFRAQTTTLERLRVLWEEGLLLTGRSLLNRDRPSQQQIVDWCRRVVGEAVYWLTPRTRKRSPARSVRLEQVERIEALVIDPYYHAVEVPTGWAVGHVEADIEIIDWYFLNALDARFNAANLNLARQHQRCDEAIERLDEAIAELNPRPAVRPEPDIATVQR